MPPSYLHVIYTLSVFVEDYVSGVPPITRYSECSARMHHRKHAMGLDDATPHSLVRNMNIARLGRHKQDAYIAKIKLSAYVESIGEV